MVLGQDRTHYVCDPSKFIVYLNKRAENRAKRKMP
jgi:hypothetical protein